MENQDISIEKIKEGMDLRDVPTKIIIFPRLASTMEAAREEVQRGTGDETLIIAGEQTAGRGRSNHTWFSPIGNIALSYIIYTAAANFPYLIMVASLATAHSIEYVTGLRTQIKWPNDILIKGKKVAGILIESVFKGKPERDLRYAAIIGIGINVASNVRDINEISAVATGLEDELGEKISREELIRAFLGDFKSHRLDLVDGKTPYNEWRDRLVTLGQKVTALWGDETLEGTAESVDESGALWIRRTDGTLTRVVAGDVTLRNK